MLDVVEVSMVVIEEMMGEAACTGSMRRRGSMVPSRGGDAWFIEKSILLEVLRVGKRDWVVEM